MVARWKACLGVFPNVFRNIKQKDTMIFWVVFLYALFATVFPLGRASLAHAQPIFLTGVRMLVAGIALLGYYYLFNRRVLIVSIKNLVSRNHLWQLLVLLPHHQSPT